MPESSRHRIVRHNSHAMTHRFAEARDQPRRSRVTSEHRRIRSAVCRLSIDQAMWTKLDSVLEVTPRSCRAARASGGSGAAGFAVGRSGRIRRGRSHLPVCVAGIPGCVPVRLSHGSCFQLGALWGELVPEPELSRAAQWYRKAIDYLPCYVKARVHLAEIHFSCGRYEDAEALLLPVIEQWRSGSRMASRRRDECNWVDSQRPRRNCRRRERVSRPCWTSICWRLRTMARSSYAGSGNNPARAFELARLNLANRPTLRAFKQAYATATAADEAHAASDILAAAQDRWGATTAFRLSSLGAL